MVLATGCVCVCVLLSFVARRYVLGTHVSSQDHAMVSDALKQHKSLLAELDARCAEQQQELVAAVQHAARLESRAIAVDQELERCKTALQVGVGVVSMWCISCAHHQTI